MQTGTHVILLGVLLINITKGMVLLKANLCHERPGPGKHWCVFSGEED